MTMWTIIARINGRPEDILGLLPMIFDSNDPRPAREQANERYAHGGGWNPQEGWELNPSNGNAHLSRRPADVAAGDGRTQ